MAWRLAWRPSDPLAKPPAARNAGQLGVADFCPRGAPFLAEGTPERPVLRAETV
jgi:hypothetical protein